MRIIALTLAFIAAIFSSAFGAETIQSGHVLGNGTASERTPTDTAMLPILQQSGSGLDTSLRTALGLTGNVANGFAIVGATGRLPSSIIDARAGLINCTAYMTDAQIADGTSRTDSIDVAAALNTCFAAGIAAQRGVYLPGGKWKATGAQLVFAYTSSALGITLYGDGTNSTLIDMQGNAANPPLIWQINGAVAPTAIGMTYGGIEGVGLACNVAGACVWFGQGYNAAFAATGGFPDQLNQLIIKGMEIQNFNNTSNSTCGVINGVFSTVWFSVNCSTAAGPAGNNFCWVMNGPSFNTFYDFGGSNCQTEAQFSSAGTAAGNSFYGWDCEIVALCLLITSPTAVQNTWYSGTWGYCSNPASGPCAGITGFGVSESAGGDNHAFVPNINATLANFFANIGTQSLFQKWNNASLTPLTSPTFSGTPVISNSAVNSSLNLTSSTNTLSLTENTSGNAFLTNTASAKGLNITQNGAGTITLSINGASVAQYASSHGASAFTVCADGSGNQFLKAGVC